MVKQFISRNLTYSNLGFIDYKTAWDIQHNLHADRVLNKIDDTLILLEHPHTYTFGKSSSKDNLLITKSELDEKNIELFDIDRGGDVTYHGPGQIVGYPIIDLGSWEKDTHKYLRNIEEVIIRTLKEFEIEATRIKEHTGVWIGNEKIAAIGIKVSRWVTMHGFALNVNTDMNLFDGIIPCGITDKGVTSLQNILGKSIDIEIVKKKLVSNFKILFEYDRVEIKNKV